MPATQASLWLTAAQESLWPTIPLRAILTPMPTVPLQVRILPHAAELPLPRYETEHAAGMDLRAAIAEPILLNPGTRAAVPTGLQIAIPPGFEAQVRPRSGLAARHGVTLTNPPGTIDADFRGEVTVLLINLSQEPFTVSPGDRIAQLIVAPVVQATWEVVEELPSTDRGEGGFGHTGVK